MNFMASEQFMLLALRWHLDTDENCFAISITHYYYKENIIIICSKYEKVWKSHDEKIEFDPVHPIGRDYLNSRIIENSRF